MKLSLVVSEGAHIGKVIPITSPEFVIGRDPECQLRPASPQVSKKHCAVVVRDGKIYVRDYGSMNGTFVNNEQVAGEREVKHGDFLKAGPLAFTVTIEMTAARPAAKPAAEGATSKSKSSINVKAQVAAPKPALVQADAEEASEDVEQDSEHIAAMMLNGDDDSGSADRTAEQGVPDGTTVMELPAIPGDPNAKKEKKDPNTADTSGAAAAILQKYMRRPRT